MGKRIECRIGGMEMKKRFLTSIIYGLIVASSAFAGGIPKLKLKKNQVAVIAKVNVNTKSNMEFFNRAFECTDEDIMRPGNYFFPIVYNKNDTYDAAYIEYLEEVEEAEEGQYCVALYTLPANRTIYFTSGIRYMYHKIYTMDISLPTNFKLQVPEDVKCIYLGDLTYIVEGDNFEVTGCKVTDSFDKASEFLTTVPGLEKEQLCHGELNRIEESDIQNLVKKAAVNLSKGQKRFTMMNRVYSYR